MEKDILEGKIGEVGAYDLEFKEKKLKFKVSVAHTVGVEAELGVSLSALAIKEAIKKAIPGQVDDAILDLVFSPLLAD